MPSLLSHFIFLRVLVPFMIFTLLYLFLFFFFLPSDTIADGGSLEPRVKKTLTTTGSHNSLKPKTLKPSSLKDCSQTQHAHKLSHNRHWPFPATIVCTKQQKVCSQLSHRINEKKASTVWPQWFNQAVREEPSYQLKWDSWISRGCSIYLSVRCEGAGPFHLKTLLPPNFNKIAHR